MNRDVESLLRQQAALAGFGSFAFREANLSTVFEEAARVCAVSLNTTYCVIYRFGNETAGLVVEAGCGWEAGVVGQASILADESTPAGRAMITGRPIAVGNIQAVNDYRLPAFYAQHGIVSIVDVLIETQTGAPFGVLEVASPLRQLFDQHDINFLTGFANVLAEAVAASQRNPVLDQALARVTSLVQERDQLRFLNKSLASEMPAKLRATLRTVNNMLSEQLQQTSDPAGQHQLRGLIEHVMRLD